MIPGSGRSPGEGNGYPLQYSCMENPMDRGARRVTVHKVAESDTTEQLTSFLLKWGEETTGVCRGHHAAKHLSMPRTASTTRNCPSPNVQSGRVESESVSHSVMFVIPMDYSPSGSSVHGVLQARILEWVAIHFSRGSSQSRDQTWVSCITGRLYHLSHHEVQCQG